jgi:hypothetical protein
MSEISVRLVKNPTEAEIQRMTAVLVDAFEGGASSSRHKKNNSIDSRTNTDEFEKWMVGGNLDLLPLVNDFQIRMGLIAGEVCTTLTVALLLRDRRLTLPPGVRCRIRAGRRFFGRCVVRPRTGGP